jgi:DNA-binding IclR family transcriptional regulator
MKRSGTQSLERGIALLREIAQSNRAGLTLAELVERARLDRTTTHRMLKCLVTEQLLAYDSQERKYRLGSLVFQMGMASGDMFFRDAAAGTLTRLAEETGDTVFLMMLSGYESVCVDRREGSYPVKTLVVEVGTRRPLGVGAAALAMLASLKDDDVKAAIAANRARIASAPNFSEPGGLMRMVQTTRKQQYSSMPVPGVPGVRSVGYPICMPDDRVIAAISIAAIEPRMGPAREKMLAATLKEAVRKLVTSLSGGRSGSGVRGQKK